MGRISEVIVQEKIVGTEYLIDAASYAGQHKISTVHSYKKYIVNNMPIYRSLNMVDENNPRYEQLAEYTKKIIDALGVEYGLSHTEVIVTENNEVKLMELNLRPSGLGGFLNDIVYEHKKINQFILAQDLLENKTTSTENDGKVYCMFILNNPGFTYRRVKVELLNDIASYQNIKLLKPVCEHKPERTLLADSVAILHLAHASPDQLQADKDLLEQYEKDGTLFEE
ncbi:MAG: ATP-grasp domain-containing protein [Bacteroidia bacterium]